MKKAIDIVDKLITKKYFAAITIIMILTSGFSPTYFLGGDDSGMSYIYPLKYFQNLTSQMVTNTGLSQLTNYVPPLTLAAYSILMVGLKTLLPTLNLQAMLNTANLLGGTFFFYLFVSYLLKPKDKYDRFICLLASFSYVFSIYNFYSLLFSKLVNQYVISLFPLSLYLGLKSVYEKKLYLLILVTIIWSIFCLFTLSLPISGGALLTSLPLLIFSLWKYKLRTFMYIFTVAPLIILLNLHWIIALPYTNFSNNLPGSMSSSITSTEFREQNSDGIKIVSKINNSFFPLINSYHQQIQLNFSWPQLPIYQSWYSKVLWLGFFYLLILIIAGMHAKDRNSKTSLYLLSTLSLLIAIYFYTVRVSPWGITIFTWLNNHIPGFVMFRNMYDKFAYALSFQWGLALAISLSIVSSVLGSQKKKLSLLILVTIIAVINAKPYLSGDFSRLPYWTTKNSFDSITQLNRDYMELVKFIEKQETDGRYLSLPLLSGNSIIVEDEYKKNHYYAGVSPLLILTGKNDFSGLMSFTDSGKDVYHLIKNKQNKEFGMLLQKLNVKYVITTNFISEDLQNSFMFYDNLYHIQTPEFMHSILGTKVKDFGQRYSLYEIAPQYQSQKVYLTEFYESVDKDSYGVTHTYQKLSRDEYLVKIRGLDKLKYLVFLDPYLKGWQLQSVSGKQVSGESHFVALNYANTWVIDPETLKNQLPAGDYYEHPDGQLDLNLHLKFMPYVNYFPSLLISGLTYLASFAYIIINLVWDFKKLHNTRTRLARDRFNK